MEILSKLKDDTLFSVEKLTVDRRYLKDLEFKRNDALERSLNSVDSTGISQLTKLFNKLELETICNDYLQVEHKAGNNPHSKVVLTKRLGESLEKEGLEKWFKKCKDSDILRTFAAVLGITSVPKDDDKAVAYVQKEAPAVIRRFGFQVILNRLETPDLHDICRDMKLKNHTKTNNRKALIQAIVTQENVSVPEPVVQRMSLAKKPAKKAIDKCTEYEQLFQHYFLDQLVDWCRENGVKTSGSKKVVINRILAFLGGDKENTLADETRIRRSIKRRSAAPEDEDDDEEGDEEEQEEEEEEVEVKPKKGLSDRSKNTKKEAPKKVEKKVVAKKNTKPVATKKVTKKVVEEEEEEEEKEEEEEEEQEQEQEEMTVDAERELRTTEEEDEEVNESGASDEQEESEDGGINDVVFCLTGHMSVKRDVIVKAILAAGGKVCSTVTKEVQVLVSEDPDSNSGKLVKARKDGVKVVGEDYLKKFIDY